MGFFSWLFGKSAAPSHKVTEPRAVLIGNIGYQSAPLNGCWNDVLKINRRLLTNPDMFGPLYTGGNVRMMKDAPKRDIVDACKWLAETAGPKTLLTSGHGVQIPSSSESDGFIEAFCPIDFDWSPETTMSDDEFVNIFRTCVGPFLWLSDSCHSGDLDKNLSRRLKDRFKVFPTPALIKARLRGRHKIFRSLAKGDLNLAFVSGCKSSQLSADTYIDNEYCGAMVHYFCEAACADKNNRVKNLVERTNELLKRDMYDQEPTASGNYAGLKILG